MTHPRLRVMHSPFVLCLCQRSHLHWTSCLLDQKLVPQKLLLELKYRCCHYIYSSSLTLSLQVRAFFESLPQDKWVFTNANEKSARHCLELLGLQVLPDSFLACPIDRCLLCRLFLCIQILDHKLQRDMSISPYQSVLCGRSNCSVGQTS